MKPEVVAKAARMVVVEKSPGVYQVAGDTSTYVVRRAGFVPDLHCDCRAGRGCSHALAVRMRLRDLSNYTHHQKAG